MHTIYEKLHEQIDTLPQTIVLQVIEFIQKCQTIDQGNGAWMVPPGRYTSWLTYRMNNPYIVKKGWNPLSRDEVHDR
jgi:hypothetical protein